MFALYELIDLLPAGFTPHFAPRLNKLCFFLLKQERMDNKEAARKYLGDINRLKYFNKLKLELKNELTKYLIANPSWAENENENVTLYGDSYRDFANYKIFLLSNKRKVAIELAKSLLPKLLKTELYALIHILANDLLFHYSCIDVSPELNKKYSVLAKAQLEIINIESTVREHHSRIGMFCNTKESFTPSIIKEFIRAADQTLPLLRPGVHQINRLIYSIVVSRYTVVHDYKNVIKYCKEALNSFPENHPNRRSLCFIFMYYQISALVVEEKLEEAKEIAKTACKMTPVGNFNWHLALLKRIVVCFHAGDYQEAYELYKAHEQQNCPFAILKEYWNIIRGYLHFLIHQGKIEIYAEEKFYLGKFLNEMPIYSQDKAGNNINILIIQVLIRIQRNQFGHIIDRIESLREYARKYTKNAETKRANIFINMILKMEAASFHRLGAERKTRKLKEKLKNTPLRLGQNLAIEIIPFEVLCEDLIDMLDDKFKTIKKRKINIRK